MMYYSNSEETKRQPLFMVLLTLFMSVVMEFIPFPGIVLPVKPIFPVLMLVYWVVYRPQYVNYAAAIIIGILMDLLNQVPLGFNAMSYTVIVLVTNMLRNRFVLLTGFAQALHVLVVLVIGQFVLYLLGYLEQRAVQPPLEWVLFIPSISSALLWMLIPMMFRYLLSYTKHSSNAQF